MVSSARPLLFYSHLRTFAETHVKWIQTLANIPCTIEKFNTIDTASHHVHAQKDLWCIHVILEGD